MTPARQSQVPSRRWSVLSVVSACAFALFVPTRAAAQTYDPVHRFRTINTTHFAIHFHQHEQADAEYLKTVAEATWTALRASLQVEPPRHTDVILVDQTDDTNGWATPTPRPTVMLTAAWPAGVEFIGSTKDWLRVGFTHEFAHIVHLEQSRSWATVVRRVFGRVPLAFPNTLLPAWQIEGLATFEESRITGMGRAYAGDFGAITNEAARAGHLERFDRVNGGLTAWPGGNAVYAYGLGFIDYLSGRFGQARIGDLMRATAGELPYLWPRAFTRIFGVPVGRLWSDYEAHLTASVTAPASNAGASAASDDAVRLTHRGFVSAAPRVAPGLCAGCPGQIVYSVQTPHEFPALYSLPLDGSGPETRLTSRYLGNTVGVRPSMLYFDQQEVRRNAGIYSDIYVFDRARQTVQRLSHDLRLSDPDVSPDGRFLVAVRSEAGRRDLVQVTLNSGRDIREQDLTVLARNGQFNAPRLSPDGRRVVVEQHRPGHLSEIVVVDLDTRRTRAIASAPDTRFVTPTWRPDGRAVLAAAARSGQVFNIVEIDPIEGTSRAVTHTTGGATWPEVTPDGRSLLFVGYTTDGLDLFRTPYRAVGPALRSLSANETEPVSVPAAMTGSDAPDNTRRPYRPWNTLAPTSWTPTAEWANGAARVGALVTGSDVLGYHSYAASAAWLVSQPALTTRVVVPDVSVSYGYTRWTLQPWVSTSRKTSFFGAVPDESGVPVTATVQERQLEVGVVAPTVGTRRSRALSLSFIRNVADIGTGTGTDVVNRSAFRASAAAGTGHTYGYSISTENGILAGATIEVVRRAFGADAQGVVWTGDTRVYLPGVLQHHVLALRAGVGGASGDLEAARVFLLGGGSAASGPANFGSEAFALLRGFAPDSFAGSHVVLMNADYRLPFWQPERGITTWPVFLHTLHAAAFTDAAQVWTRTRASSAWKVDGGAELSADVVIGYALPLTVASGVAFGHDAAGRAEDGWRAYVRLGRAF